MKDSSADRLMTLAELANYLHLGRNTVLELATSKKIPGLLIGKEWRFRRGSVEEWLDRQASGEDDAFEEVPDPLRLPLGDLLPEEGIVHDMRARDALGAIEELAARAYQNNWLNDKPWFVGALVEREALASTAMEGGVAFLHTRARDTSRIARPFIVVGRSHGGISFGAPDGNPTHLFFLLGLKYDRLHLPILGRLARLMIRNPKAAARLRGTTSLVRMRNTLLQLDQTELTTSTRPAPADFRGAKPKLDREMRLRAIMRLSAKQKLEEQRRASSSGKKAPAKKAAAATRATEKKATATRATAKKATAKKATTTRATAKKAPATRAPAKKAKVGRPSARPKKS